MIIVGIKTVNFLWNKFIWIEWTCDFAVWNTRWSLKLVYPRKAPLNGVTRNSLCANEQTTHRTNVKNVVCVYMWISLQMRQTRLKTSGRPGLSDRVPLPETNEGIYFEHVMITNSVWVFIYFFFNFCEETSALSCLLITKSIHVRRFVDVFC